jgi:hypothetical protein
MNSETFLAFQRGHPRALPSKANLETGISYDIAGEIDRRNGWREPDEFEDEVGDTLESIAARGLRELILFCFHGEKLTKSGAGLRRAVQKFLAVSHSLSPEMFVSGDGRRLARKSVSIWEAAPKLTKSEMAALARCEPKEFHELAKEFHERWGFKVHVTPAKAQRRRKG